MKDWKKLAIAPDATLMAAMRSLDQSAAQICLVIDGDGKLLGTVTDGDIRRGFLRGMTPESGVRDVMNHAPRAAPPGMNDSAIRGLLNSLKLRHIPIVDPAGRVLGMASLDDVTRHENWVVLLAGGLGTRLRPLTEHIPKPMLEVGGRPILHNIIEALVNQGFWRFYLSVGYRADMIMDYFGDGSRFGAEMRYLVEDGARGTAGPMSLITDPTDQPLLVMNADLMTKVDFPGLLTYHEQASNDATVCVREYEFQVPYGVVVTNEDLVKDIEEKPIHRFLVSAGIYVLAPHVMTRIPKDQRYDMPDLLRMLTKSDHRVAAYPVHEYWVDVGRPEELRRANEEYQAIFGAG